MHGEGSVLKELGMADTTVESFQSLHEWVESYADKTVIFRGVKDASYKLIPRVGRYKEFTPSKVKREEKTMLRLFREQAAHN